MPQSKDELPAPPEGARGWPWTAADPDAGMPAGANRDAGMPAGANRDAGMPAGANRDAGMPAGANKGALPRIGLVTPSFEQGRFIEQTIRSVLLQGYPALSYRVMDGGSDDGTLEILKKYDRWLDGWRSEPDAGQSDAINRGVEALDCDVIGWLNSDDLLEPGALLAVGRYLRAHPECQFVAGDGLFTGADGSTARFEQRAAPYSFDELLDYGADHYLPQPSVFFSRALFERVGGLDRSLHYAMDLDLWLRMRALVPLHHIPQRLSRLRQHEQAKTLRDNDRAMQEVTQVLRARGQGRPDSVMGPVLTNMRRARARAECARALDAYFRHDRAQALRGIWSASRRFPAVVWTPDFARVLLRVGLPGAIKRRLFVRP